MTYNWKSVAYNWNNDMKCEKWTIIEIKWTIMWIKLYTSEIMSVKLITNCDKWNKMI